HAGSSSPGRLFRSESLSGSERFVLFFRCNGRSRSDRADRHERRRLASGAHRLERLACGFPPVSCTAPHYSELMLSRDHILALMRERVHHPAGIRELLQLLKVPREERRSFKRHLDALVAAGDLIQIRGQRYGLPEKMDLYVGRLQTHPAGYGFVVPERTLDS